jgi:hypothetical protein
MISKRRLHFEILRKSPTRKTNVRGTQMRFGIYRLGELPQEPGRYKSKQRREG